MKFDWKSNHDERSREFPIRELLDPTPVTRKTWRCGTYLDQGQEGACVGFAWSHELAADPKRVPVTAAMAQHIYRSAQKLDVWEGEDYSGTSVLAGAKVVQEIGFLAEYRWAFGLEDVVATLGAYGPVVLGVPWYEGMFRPDARGYIHASGAQLGGHAICARGVNVKAGTVMLHNSWGADWGLGGKAYIRFDDLARLLAENGEACVPVLRTRPKA